MSIVQTPLRRSAPRVGVPVDGASLAVLRVGVGLVAAISIARLWLNGWLDTLIIAPAHHLGYPWFGWVPVPPAAGIRLLAVVAFIAAAAFIVGWRTRLAGAIFLVAFAWVELIEATTYLNHYWLMASLVLLLTVAPAGAAWSIDARSGRSGAAPKLIHVWALRTQVFLVYFFAGVAKLHHDWLADALPLKLWLPSRSGLALVGGLLDEAAVAHLASWGGAAFDLSIGFLLLFRRTRLMAFAALVGFHGLTAVVIPSIGLFPVLMTIAATIFFEPDWPRRLIAAFGRGVAGDRRAPVAASAAPSVTSMAFIAVLLALQLILPVRHWLIPGDARWTGEGYRLAWNVVAVEKQGSVAFAVGDDRRLVDPARWFTPYQLRVAASEPDLIVQMAHTVAHELGGDGPVQADSWVSFNGRRAERLIDPTLDLLTVDAADAGSATLPAPPGLDW